jgi:hypothetical protein
VFGRIRYDEMSCSISIDEKSKQPIEEFKWVFFIGGIHFPKVRKARKLFNSWDGPDLPEKYWYRWE